jgi:hypothetical protein
MVEFRVELFVSGFFDQALLFDVEDLWGVGLAQEEEA